MRIIVIERDLEAALKRWQKVALENRSELRKRRFAVGPSEARRSKSRLARKKASKRRLWVSR